MKSWPSVASSPTTPRFISDRSRCCRRWQWCFVGASGQQARAGERTKPRSNSTASGSACPARPAARATRSTSQLRAHRNLAAARRFSERAIDRHSVSEKITIDKSGANTAAIVGMWADSGADIEMRQSKYLLGESSPSRRRSGHRGSAFPRSRGSRTRGVSTPTHPARVAPRRSRR